MEADEIRDVILDTYIVCLQAQLRALRRLKGPEKENEVRKKRLSNIDMVYNILLREEAGMHISVIIERVEQIYGVRLDRESIVSALSKKVRRQDRFVRTGRNVFALLKATP